MAVYPAFYNGRSVAGAAYAIGQAVSSGGTTLTRVSAGPARWGSAGWESSHVKDPFVLYDAGIWKMWYSGFDGSKYQIGYATSPDGRVSFGSGSNPVVAVGSSGQWDASGCLFPVVYKDANAAAGKRYRMLYTGKNVSGLYQIGYAYSADGISWTKGGSNPVLANGTGSPDDKALIAGALVVSGGTYYFFYGGRHVTATPVDDQVCVATFTDFEGTYTKDGGNPVLARRTGDQALTANLSAGGTSVQVGASSGFVVGEVVYISDGTNGQQVAISAIPDGTHITIADVANATYTTTNSRIQTTLLALTPRCVVLESGTWKMWISVFQAGVVVGPNDASMESSYYATSASPNSGWAYSHDSNSPPLPLANLGVISKWDGRSSENPVFALDAATYQRASIVA